MFQRLHELSQCLPAREPWQRLNEGMPAIYDRGLAICFDDRGQWTEVVGIYQGNQDVVYRSGPPNGTDMTPCCKLAKSPAGTVKRLATAAGKLLDQPKLPPERRDWLAASVQSYEANAQAIAEAVGRSIREAGIDGKTHRGYVYWARSVAEPVYRWPEAKDLMVQRFLEPFASGGQRSGVCSVCGRSATVYGNVSLLACYNLDKPGSIAGGFRRQRADRNFPVCGDCALALADAVVFAETHLTSFMAGQTYMVLPYSNAPGVREELAQTLHRHPDRFHLGQAHDLVADELDLVDELRGRGDQLALHLVFFAAKNAAWRIRAEVQQLLPSRLHALQEASRQIEQAEDLAAVYKAEIRHLHIGANSFRSFAGGDDGLRAWLTALFRQETIDYRHFFHHLVDKLVAVGRSEPQRLTWTTREAWGLYRYARLTGLIIPPIAMEAAKVQDAIPNSPFGRYVQGHQDFFRRPELVVAFLSGCYAAQVASVQRQVRGAAPFTKKFMGRLLNRALLQRLYREGHGKLAQYDKLGYVITGLDPDLAAAWVSCGADWAISDEETTFAFTLGYSLAYRIGQLYGQRPGLDESAAANVKSTQD